ncbi:unnamed protein product [Triticum turgidum subsp. durum]|uniref:GPI transamidase subunit PIG-U n=1 Tax=Triticum turgidum subsp. durum TaxID=4567 RepID=A0A9R1NNI6_TRITD|nr:unnamed protein product [Triticum turgidum subsp. durum]
MAIRHYWSMAVAAVGFRLVLVLFGGDLHLASRPEVSTPLTSLRRLAEGYWLKQASMSPYSGQVDTILIYIADFIAAMLIRSTGRTLQMARNRSLKSLDLRKSVNNSVNVSAGDTASLIYLWNPWTIITCVGSCTSPIENLMVVIMLHGACSRLAPLAAFGYVMATHLSLYPAILILPVALLLGYGPDTPPTKVFLQKGLSANKIDMSDNGKVGGLQEMFEKTYGFILTVKDLSPNIGVLWYFFAEVFDFFRSFFLIVFNMNIIFMVLPLAIRLKHRPCFLAFVYTAIVAMLKSYPSCSQGTGNANFYFATGLAYTCLQTVLVVETFAVLGFWVDVVDDVSCHVVLYLPHLYNMDQIA